jgi:integrase
MAMPRTAPTSGSEKPEPVRFELTEPTREALDNYLRMTDRKAGEYLFPGSRNRDRPLSTRQYARLVCKWVGGLDSSKFATHSLRRYAESQIMPRLLSRTPVAWTYIMALAGSSA